MSFQGKSDTFRGTPKHDSLTSPNLSRKFPENFRSKKRRMKKKECTADTRLKKAPNLQGKLDFPRDTRHIPPFRSGSEEKLVTRIHLGIKHVDKKKIRKKEEEREQEVEKSLQGEES